MKVQHLFESNAFRVEEWLQRMGILSDYTINDDLSVDVRGQ